MLLDFRKDTGKFNRKYYAYYKLLNILPTSRHHSISRHYLGKSQKGVSFDIYSNNPFIIGQLDVIRYTDNISLYESYIINILIYNLDDMTKTSYFEIKFSPGEIEFGLIKRKEVNMIEIHNQFTHDIFINFICNVIECYPKYLSTLDEKADRFLENRNKAEEELKKIWEETIEWCK